MIRINNISLPLSATTADVKLYVQKKLGIQTPLHDFKIAKKSVDARHKNNVHFVYSADCNEKPFKEPDKDIELLKEVPPLKFSISKDDFHPVVVGSGPSGMFAALALAEAGLSPIILERGESADKRLKKVHTFWKTGILDEQSNVQFGEGGAGTFSDGKLMSGIKKDAFTAKVFEELYTAGAPEEILYLAKPHIGTDNLMKVVQNIRKKIISLGGEYRFESQLIGLKIQNEHLQALKVQDVNGVYELPASKLFLAIGHSARDTFEMLYKAGLQMSQKPFSVGVRIEHPQSLIDQAQYGSFASSPYLGAADYKMAVHLENNRSLYTFCMCPGGVVVASTSQKNHVVTNGMSYFARDKQNANAALLVGVDRRDFQSDDVLAGVYFQEQLEKKAFLLGGQNYFAPAQLVGDFLKEKASTKQGSVLPSYQPGVTFCDFKHLFSGEILSVMRKGLVEMGKKLRGFDMNDAVLTGVETRSSSPVRIIRDEHYQSNIKGIFPCGEGAGYAGGITSSAADGLKAVYSLNEG